MHRGPDGYGIEVFGEDLGVALLVHRRLSILGLGEAGAQPMISADGRYAISFNGEIYNYLELAEEHGLSNLSGTDTEILLQLWQDLGRAVLDKLDGFFAMAIWDNAEKTLTLVRDRTGVKPIYYCCNAQGFWFGSEEFALVKAMELVGETTKINTNALQAHSLRGIVIARHCMKVSKFWPLVSIWCGVGWPIWKLGYGIQAITFPERCNCLGSKNGLERSAGDAR